MKILLIEDDELVVQALTEALTNQHYTVDVADDGQKGWELVSAFTYDLIVLDVMLPKLDGIALCQRLRSQGVQVPILLLTAQNTSTNKILGLDAGADDYVTKPFDLQVLLARIRALLRRGQAELPPLLSWGNLGLDPSTCEVTCDRQLIHLTPKEYGLLELFLRNPHRVYSRSSILNHIWALEASPGEETVTAHIKGLRQKLKAAGIADDPVETVYGIGYRLKPSPKDEEQNSPSQQRNKAPDICASAPSTEAPLEREQQARAEVASIWERVQEKLRKRVSLMEQATTAMLKSQLSNELRLQAQQEAHKLAGSLGMFDLDEGSRLARAMERLFQLPELNKEQMQQLSALAAVLRRELQQSPIGQPKTLQQPLLLIVSPDESFSEELAIEASVRGLRSKRLSSTEARWIVNPLPDVVLLDLGDGKNVERSQLELLGELKASTPPVPVIVSSSRNLRDRIQIARLGGRKFLKKPMPSAQVLDAVTQVLQQTRYQTARVMVVDDDPQVLIALRHLLQPWGMRLSALENPLQFWNTLEKIEPDLLILDVEMPQVNGLELCQVVRNDPRWTDLPVLLLTVRTDAEMMQQVFAYGADDFVSKPIVGPELIARILNRLERSRLYQSRIQIDPLTGVANYRFSLQELAEFIEMARRYSQPLCLAVLQLDCLKQINEQYGHAIANQALSQFGKLLRQTFQSEDVVARWGGAEFVVGMYAMTKTDGVQRLTEVREKLQQKAIALPERLEIAFSAGVVQYPRDGTQIQTLYQAANALLRPAEAAGDRIKMRE